MHFCVGLLGLQRSHDPKLGCFLDVFLICWFFQFFDFFCVSPFFSYVLSPSFLLCFPPFPSKSSMFTLFESLFPLLSFFLLSHMFHKCSLLFLLFLSFPTFFLVGPS